MKIVIFAGGVGRRLWPISRQKSPKQFEPIIGSSSTVQLAVERVQERYGSENIFVSTNEMYLDVIRSQLPQLPRHNIVGEPERRNLAPAVGLCMAHLAMATGESHDDEAVAILWGDSYLDNTDTFLEVLNAAEQLVQRREAGILFIGETPRFANANLGWIELGSQLGASEDLPYFAYKSLAYRPAQAECDRMFATKSHVWNTGYFVTTIGFVRQLYRQYQPELWSQLCQIEESIGGDNYEGVLRHIYPQVEPQNFDDAILVHIRPEQAMVLHAQLGWSDPGTLYALKEALNPEERANVTAGRVVTTGTLDSLIYNYQAEKLLVTVGLQGMIVINTDDALLVVHKDDVPLVKKIVAGFEGTELERYS